MRASLSPIEARLCGPKYLDVPALWRGRARGTGATDLGAATAVVVGEAPGPNTSSACPMFPYPPQSAGGRLLALSGIPPEEYLRRFARTNLLDAYPHDGKWRKAHRIVAMDRAVEVMREVGPGGRIVLCGKNVARAFLPFTVDLEIVPFEPAILATDRWIAYLPHPSGRSRVYNAEVARTLARDALRAAALESLPPCPSCNASPAMEWAYPVEVECHCGARLVYRRGIGGEVETEYQEDRLIVDLIASSSVGRGLANIRENGIDAELDDLDGERQGR